MYIRNSYLQYTYHISGNFEPIFSNALQITMAFLDHTLQYSVKGFKYKYPQGQSFVRQKPSCSTEGLSTFCFMLRIRSTQCFLLLNQIFPFSRFLRFLVLDYRRRMMDSLNPCNLFFITQEFANMDISIHFLNFNLRCSSKKMQKFDFRTCTYNTIAEIRYTLSVQPTFITQEINQS